MNVTGHFSSVEIVLGGTSRIGAGVVVESVSLVLKLLLLISKGLLVFLKLSCELVLCLRGVIRVQRCVVRAASIPSLGSMNTSLVCSWGTRHWFAIVKLREELLHHSLIVTCRVATLRDELAVALRLVVVGGEEILLRASRLVLSASVIHLEVLALFSLLRDLALAVRAEGLPLVSPDKVRSI